MSSESDAKTFIPALPSAPLSVRRTSTTVIPKKKLPIDTPKNEISNNDGNQTRTFNERYDLAIDERFEYERKGNDPGLVLIFNHENFNETSLTPRRGSRRDVNEIIITMQRQGINISEDDILTDAVTEEINNKIRKVTEMNLEKYNFLIVYFLTHGEENNFLHTKDGRIKTSDIWAPFSRCKSLENKPKMFVFQACKGDGYTTTGSSPRTPGTPRTFNIIPTSTFKTNHLTSDMLVVYSTIEGNVSFRNPLIGTWFIQELCKNINTYGKRDDVISLLLRTTKCVCGSYYFEKNKEFIKQMPMFVSTLSKKFYLNRNKDRNHILRIIENDQKTVEELEIIKKHLKALFEDK